jgi:hypothetical protein
MARVPVNKPARVTASFKDESGNKYDPSIVKLRVGLVVPRSGQRLYEATYIYPAGDGDGTIVKDSTGDYHADITMTEVGWLQYQWEGDNVLDPIGWDQIDIVNPPFSA